MAPRLFVGDEELGKRDDEYRPGMKTPLGLGITWQQRRVHHAPLRRTIKRMGIIVLGLFVIYLFIHNLPTDLKPPRQRPSYIPKAQPGEKPVPAPAKKDDPKKSPVAGHSGTLTHGKEKEVIAHDFNGPIKFYDLAPSLHAAAAAGGAQLINNNVVFAAASLTSAATLLPIACEMALQDRNYVHFALMGRDDIDMEVLKSVNGIGRDCKVTFHDARPDFSLQSSDFRMEVVASAGFNHINNFIHPQATIIDGSGEEDVYMMKGLKPRAISLGRTVIELPKDAEQTLMWLTLLDSQSLSAWNKASIDIVVHAQLSASGSLMRLLNSLKNADYFSSAPPRLTIELPHEVDAPTKRYLQNFRWPPNSDDTSGSLLMLHHRIPQDRLTPEENSIRFLESFWPADPDWANVLVLAPHAEISPLFFHYLKYAMLEYRYSQSKTGALLHRTLMGVSLDMPSTYLNDSTSFSPPITNTSGPTPFLWQAPNSNAALYFGDKWVEAHDFVARSLASHHQLPTPKTLNKKLASTTYPSWLEHLVRLARARGYVTLYPGVGQTDSLATLHNELYHTPEEYTEDVSNEKELKSGEMTADPEQHKSLKNKELTLIDKPLWTILPFKGKWPLFEDMPLLAWDGPDTVAAEISLKAATYCAVFRNEIGGCGIDSEEKMRIDMSAEDLFCLGNKEVTHENKMKS